MAGLQPSMAANVVDKQEFNVGTRKSKLALVQTDLIVSALSTAWPDKRFNICAHNTAAGDIDKVTPFKDMPVKNLWTHELERMLVEEELDVLVHSLKDVPTQLPEGCILGGIPQREDPRDAFVLKAGRPRCTIDELPEGSVIGTSSIRRSAQIALKHPKLKIVDMRGNVPTRLSKLDAEGSQFDALILASAGLIRLGLEHRITQYLDSKNGGMLYAVGQGAIGTELRESDTAMKGIMERVNHEPSALACLAERSLLRTLEGGCSAPLGVETEWIGQSGHKRLQLRALVVSVNGKESAAIEKDEVIDNVEAAEEFGVKVAEELRERGAGKILEDIERAKPFKEPTLEI